MALSREAGAPPPGRRHQASGINRPRGSRRARRRIIPRPLRNRAYRRVLAYMLIAMPGRFADMTLVAWLVVENTDSPLAVALITIVRFIPFLFAGPLVGILIDRVPRVLLVRVAHGLFLASALAMTAAHLMGTVPLIALYAYAAVGGIAWTIEIPARRAYSSRAVGRESITAAFALEMLVWNLGAILGANVAGALLTSVPPSALFAGIASTSAFALMLLRGLPEKPRADSPTSVTPARAASLRQLFIVVRSSRILMAGLGLVAIANFFGFAYESLVPVFAVDILGVGPAGLGLMMSASAIGGLASSLTIAFFAQRVRRQGLAAAGGTIGLSLAAITFSLSASYPLSVVTLIAAGALGNFQGVMITSLLVLAAPRDWHGRILGVQMFVIGAFPVGTLALGLLANSVGPAHALTAIATGGVVLAAVLPALVPELRRPPRPDSAVTGAARTAETSAAN